MSGKGAELGNKRREGKRLRGGASGRTTLTITPKTSERIARIHAYLVDAAFSTDASKVPASVRAKFFGKAISRANVADVALEMLEDELGIEIAAPPEEGTKDT